MTQTDDALKPCPFCGGEAEHSVGKTGDGKPWHYVECVECGASGPNSPYADHNIAVVQFRAEAWNTRADLATQPDPMGAVKVKPLVWDGAGDRLSASVFGLSIAYRITGKPSDWTLMKTGATSYIHEKGFETQKAAKTAAQADYETRIRSALEPTQPDLLADPRVMALVEAVRHERELACQDFDMQLAASKAVDEALAAFNTTDKPQGANNEAKGGKADE